MGANPGCKSPQGDLRPGFAPMLVDFFTKISKVGKLKAKKLNEERNLFILGYIAVKKGGWVGG